MTGRADLARPPEPISNLLRFSDLIVEAEVMTIYVERADAPLLHVPDDWVDVGRQYGSQVVGLHIFEVLKGVSPPGDLIVEKPIAQYLLATGMRGPFLLAHEHHSWMVLGRYGPFYRTVEDVVAAIRDAPNETIDHRL